MRLLVSLLFVAAGLAQFRYCLDLCTLGTPSVFIDCSLSGASLNVTGMRWGCNNAQAARGSTDQRCDDPAASPLTTSMPGPVGPNACTWSVQRLTPDDNSLLTFTWSTALGYADLGTDPVLKFQASLTNPPPSTLDIVLTSSDSGIRCLITFNLVNTGQQPQSFTAAFTSAVCPVGFNPHSVARLAFSVNGPLSTIPAGFTLIQSGAPFQGPCFEVAACPVANFTAVKSTSFVGSVTAAATTLSYSVLVTNTGQVNLTNLNVVDQVLGNIACAPVVIGGTLVVGASTTCTGSHVVTQAEMNAGGSIVNTAQVSFVEKSGPTNAVVIPIQQTPRFSVSKTVSPLGAVSQVGAQLSYSMSVTNLGNVDLAGFNFVDPLIAVTCTLAQGGVLLVQRTTQCGGTYTVTQSDFNTKTQVVNTASASFSGLAAQDASVTTPLTRVVAFSLTKTADLAEARQAGDVINYTITIGNLGNADLTGLSVIDPLVSNLVCAPTTQGGVLLVSTSTSCRGSIVVTQANLNSGQAIVNTATVSFASPSVAPQSASATTLVTGTPALTVSKFADLSVVSAAGQVITYTVPVRNTGNVDLQSLNVSDARLNPSGISCAPFGQSQTLPVGSSTVCTGRYTTTQQDILSGSVLVNTVTVTTTRTPATTATASVNVQQTAMFSISKTTNVTTVDAAGQIIPYTIMVSNTGTLTLTNFAVADPLVQSGTGQQVQCSPPLGGSLPAGTTATCTATYVVTQANVNSGSSLVNVASAQFTQIGPQSAQVASVVLRRPSLTIGKTQDRATPVTSAPSKITYTISVRNTGNVDLNNYQVLDQLVQNGNNDLSCSPALGSTILVGASATCQGSYTVSQGDLNAKTSITNVATATSSQTPTPVSASVTASLVATPLLTLVKVANSGKSDSSGASVVDAAGTRIVYTMTVANGGNVDLSSFSLQDPLITNVQNDLACGPTAVGSTLRVGTSTTCTGSYVVTSGDMSSGSPIVNVATASTARTSPLSANATTLVIQKPSFLAQKRADVTSVNAAGNRVNYNVTITNTGNVALITLTAIDTRVTSLSCSPVSFGANLPTGQSTVCRGSYDVSQADVNAGLPLVNTATVSFTNSPAQTPTASVNVVQNKDYTVTKSVNKLTTASAGDVLSYTVVVNNVGNTDLLNLQLSDPLVSLQCSPAGNGGTLVAFTGSTTCRGTYTTTQDDINRGTSIINTVSVSLGGVPMKVASATTSVSQNRALAISKTPSVQVVDAAGQQIQYSIRVINVGNVDLDALAISDPLLPNMACTPVGVGGNLRVGAATVCQGTYSVAQSDINAGVPIRNTATASAPLTSVVSATASVNIRQSAMLTASKTVNVASVNASGTVLFYTITITNTGNEDLTNLQVSDPLTSNSVTCSPVAIGSTLTVAVRQTVCTTTYTVLQKDINAGVAIVNNATVVTTQAGPVVVQATTSVVRTPSVAIFKQASRSSVTAAGQQIDYVVQVLNTGNVDLQNLQVDDALVDSSTNNLACSPIVKGATLLVGGATTCRGSVFVSQARINSGVDIVNVAGVTTLQTARVTAQATTTVSQQPAFVISKSASVSSVDRAGQLIMYSIVVTNQGNVDLQNLQVSDARLSSTLTCGPVPVGSTLTVAQPVTTCTGSYVATQQDINLGQTLVNTATAQFAPLTGLVQPQTASASVNVVARPVLSVTKVADRTTVTAAGQVVSYTITATNGGNQDLQNFQLSDSLIPSATLRCAPVGLGQTLSVSNRVTTCSGTYTVTQADMNRGSGLVNTVVAQSAQTAPASAQATVNILQSPSFSIAKTVDLLVVSSVGQRLRYSILVRNTGNLDLTNFDVRDARIVAVQNDLTCSPVARGQTLRTAQLTTCTGSYVVTQNDMNSGSAIVNTATASFQQVQPLSASVTTSVSQNAALTIAKSANKGSVSSLGEIIAYTITVVNGGNVDLTSVLVSDSRVTGLSCSPVAGGGTLAVSQVTTCTGFYAVTQADLNAGVPLLNTASASSTQTKSVSAVAAVNVNQDARFNVTKTASLSSVSAAGDVIQYAIQISNIGNEDLAGLRVTDALIAISPGNNNLQCSPVAVGQTLTVGSPRTTCTGSLTVSQALIDAGDAITNVATVAFAATGAQNAVVNTNVIRSPSFTLSKVVDQGSVSTAGQTLRYTIRVENIGNTNLKNMQVADFLIETGSRDLACSPVTVGATLPVRGVTTCVGTFVVSQSVINAGASIVNSVSVQFTEASAQTAAATTTVTQIPAFTIAKTVDKSSVDGAGQVLQYSITVQNRGNVDLANFQLSDPLVDGSSNNIRCTPVARGATLTVATGTTVCTGSYTVRQADVNAGLPILNLASASFVNAQPLTAQASTSVVQRPLLSIAKTANRPSVSSSGDVVGFSVVVRNEGNVDLVNLQVRDDLVDSLANDLRCTPVSEGSVLPVGVSTTCTGTFVATQQTINSGAAIVNTALAAGGSAAQVSASVTVGVVQSPAFAISKTSNVERVSAAGGVITWTVKVINTGNVDLTGFALVDPLVDSSSGNMACLPVAKGGILGVKVETTCIGTYIVTQADVNTQTTISNVATASFAQSSSASASALVTVVASPALSISKTASPTLVHAAGEVITYTVIVTNIGNVDLPALAVTDPRVPSLACSPVTFGATLTVANPVTRCTGTYITTQADIDLGVPLVNIATASSARSAAVAAQAAVNILGVAMFDVTKTSDALTAIGAGQRIRYAISITNTGTVDLTNLRVSDPLVDQSTTRDISCSPVAVGGTLTVSAPSTLCTASYVVTQEDMDRGDSLVNVATVVTTQAGPKSAQTTTVVSQRPSLTVSKTADLGVVSSSNTTIRYTILVRNTGNVGLLNLQVADDLVDANRQPLTCQPVAEGTTLPVGGSTTCLGAYQVTQADLNSGAPLVNTATVRATNYGPLSASATTRIQQNPSLTLSKSGDKTQVSRSGEVVSYSLLVTNTGNVDLVNLAVADPLIDQSSNNLVCFPVSRGGTLTVSQPATRCVGTYTVPQSVLNAGGSLVNTAFASSVQTQPVSAFFATQVIQTPLVIVSKVADRASVSNEGDVIQYSIVVSNRGNVDLTAFEVLDPLIDGNSNDLTCQPTARTAGVLLTNQTTRCSGTFVVPQSVINVGGVIRNAVTVSSAQGASASAFVTTQVVQAPAMQVTKTADRLTVNTAGQVIRFSISIRNTGNLDLNNLQVIDELVDAGTNDLSCSPYGRGQTLPTDAGVTTCTGSYVVTQQDLNAGGIIRNSVSVSSTQTAAVGAEANTIVAQNARLIVVKSADPVTVSFPGQTISYSIRVHNAGNIDLTQLSVVDDRVDSGVVTCAPIPQGQVLRVGVTTVCVGSKQVTQAVIDSSVPIVNTATVSTLQSGPVSAMATVNVAQSALLVLTKTGSVGSVDRAGQVVTYSVVAENAGTVVLNNFQLSDKLLDNVVTCSPTSIGGSLIVGAKTTCVGSYTISQNDLNSGANIVNVATAQTTEVGPVTAMETTKVQQLPAFIVSKTATPASVSRAGEVVTFSIRIVNTGNVDLDGVRVTDKMIQLGENNLRCAPVAEGASLTVSSPTTTCVGTYVVSQADVNAGVDLVNFASVNSNQFGPVSARATVTVTPQYSLSVVKRASLVSVRVAGQIITWSLVITNTGTADLPNLRVIDPLIQNSVNDLKCSPVRPGSTLSALSPTTTCSGTYVVTQQDLNSGSSIVNTVTVAATGLASALTASASVDVVQTPSFVFSKQADRTFVDESGLVILYTMIVRNTGNVDLPNFQISDPLVDGGSNNMVCRPVPKGGVLTVAVGLINCTGSSTVTQAQMNVGAPIVNTATVSFSAAGLPSQSANASTAVVREPLLTVTKQADRFSVTSAGQDINYEILITNTGNVDLTNVNIVDALVGLTLQCSPVVQGGTLTVVQSVMRCTAKYTTTQQDIDRGVNIVNTVTVSSAQTQPVTASAVTFLTQTALLHVQKTADKTTVTQPGEGITYSIVVRNVGNVAQTGVTVTDTRVPVLSCVPPTSTPLPVGGSISCSGSYTVTGADISAGSQIVNVVSVRSAQVTVPVTAQATVNVFSFPQFSASKRANVTSVSAVGSAIAYTVEVLNTGTVALTGMTVSDPLVQSLSCSPVTQGGTLARAARTTCTGINIVTQQNINDGVPIINRALVTFANAGTVVATATVGVNSVTAFVVSKTAQPFLVTTGAGTLVAYSVVVTNTGSSDLTGFQINDPLFPGGMTCSPVAPGQTLSRAASTTCTGQYSLTAGDVSRGTVVNVVTITLGGLQRSASALVTIRPATQGQLTLTKTASPTFVSAAGQTVTYVLTARNVGTTPLLAVTISDPLIPVALACLPVPNGQALLPGTFINCTGVLVVSQQQVNSGIIQNTASATAAGLGVPLTASASVVVSATAPPTTTVASTTATSGTTTPSRSPIIHFSKTSSPVIVSTAGQSILYTIMATNGGLNTLQNVLISDSALGFLLCSPPLGSPLVSGASMTCSGSSVVSALQIQAGADIVNTATVSANGLSAITQAKAIVKVAVAGTLGVSKTTTATSYSVVGTRIPYTVTILNNLNVNAQSLSVTDASIDATTNDLVCTPVPRGGTLAVGATTLCSGTLVVTQGLLGSGQPVVNTAVVSTTSAPGQTFSSSVSTPKGTQGQLVFQISIINGQIQFIQQRDEMHLDETTHQKRDTDLSGVRLRITDSTGAVYFVNLTSTGVFSGQFAPGLAEIFILSETLPPGITLVAGTNPTIVTIPANGVIGAQVVFSVQTFLGGSVYYDVNGNGVRDSNEPGIANARVALSSATSGSVSVFTNATGFWVSAVAGGEATTALIDTTTLGLGSSVVQTQGTNPTAATVPSGTSLFLAPSGFRVASTTPPTQPPPQPPAGAVGDTEINFRFAGILKGACGCNSCPCQR